MTPAEPARESATALDGSRARPRSRRGVWIGVAVFAGYMLAAIAAAVIQANTEFAFYIVVMLLLAAAVTEVHRRVNLSDGLLAGLVAWGGLHMAGGLVPVPASWPIAGDVPVLYSWWLIPGYLKYDQVVHFFGFGVTTWLCWEGLAATAGGLRPTLGPLLICATAAMGFGALNEIVEFAATKLGPTNVGGYENTAWDLVANATGAFIAAVAICLTAGRRAVDSS